MFFAISPHDSVVEAVLFIIKLLLVQYREQVHVKLAKSYDHFFVDAVILHKLHGKLDQMATVKHCPGQIV